MNKEEFLKLYWKNYILLEKEFMETLDYIDLDTDNYDVYSPKYIKLLLQIGSEVDVSAKLLCKQHNAQSKAKNIDEYKTEIMSGEKDFCHTEVNVELYSNITPFSPWESWKQGVNPDWWGAYNKVKHRRFESGDIGGTTKLYYKFANLKYTLFALGGLYQLLIYCYFNIINTSADWTKTPVPGSRLFRLAGNKWDNIDFYQDLAFHIDERGHLTCKTGIY